MEEKRSIRQVSEELNIPKDTLRYYDKLNLVKPLRGENEYRYYTQEDLLDLQYIEVMKYAGFSLKEIGKIFENKHACTEKNFNSTLHLLKEKKKYIGKKIEMYHNILQLMTDAEDAMNEKKQNTDEAKLNDMITEIFKDLRGAGDEK